MTDLKLMIERISEREKNAIRIKQMNTEEKAERDVKFARENAEKKLAEEKERILKELENEFSMKENTEDVNFRNAVLREKQRFIQKIFKDAVKKFDEISSEEFMQIVAAALENVDVTQTVTLVLGERSKDLFDQNWLGQHLPWNHHVRVSDEVAKNKSGVLVRRDNIDYNYFFDELIEECHQEFLSHITNELFENK